MAAKVKVKFLQSPTGRPFFMAYSPGHFADVDHDQAKALETAGIAEIVEVVKPVAKAPVKAGAKAPAKAKKG